MATALNNKQIILLTKDKTEEMRIRIINALSEYFIEHEKNGRKLFALTITYTKDNDSYKEINSLSTIKNRFHHWYWNRLLPNEIFCSKKWLETSKSLQPYVFIFTEKHNSILSNNLNFPNSTDRLHHHAILAVSPETKNKFLNLMDRNDLSDLCQGVMTVKLKNADTLWIDYCMKDFCKNDYEINFYGPTMNN